MTRLTMQKVEQIRAKSKRGASYQDLADEYGVYRETIARAVRRETWRRDAVLIPRETIESARAMVAAGEKHDAVAFDLGLSRSYVTHVANRTRRASG